jgi:hypothetical protein
MLLAHGDPMVGRGQLSRFLLFRKKKYRCVGRQQLDEELIASSVAFLRRTVVKMFQSISILGVTL